MTEKCMEEDMNLADAMIGEEYIVKEIANAITYQIKMVSFSLFFMTYG